MVTVNCTAERPAPEARGLVNVFAVDQDGAQAGMVHVMVSHARPLNINPELPARQSQQASIPPRLQPVRDFRASLLRWFTGRPSQRRDFAQSSGQ